MKSLISVTEGVLIRLLNAARDRHRRHERSGPAAEGVLIGHSRAVGLTQGEEVRLSSEDRGRHLYILGSTGCGKTNLVLRLIESDLETGATLCVLDLRGDLVDRILLRVASHADEGDSRLAERLSLVDLRQDRFIAGFNPLSGAGEVHTRALHVLGDLRRHADSWGVQLDETLRSALIALAEAGLSLLEIEPLLCDSEVRAAVVGRCKDPLVRSFFARFGELSPEYRSSWTTPVLNKVSPFLSVPRVRLMFGAGTELDLRRLLDTPGKIVLIVLAVDRLREASHLIGSMLVSAIESAILARVDQPETHRHAVHLYVDEFETMASPSFRALVAEGRRFGLSLTLSHQNLGQVDSDLRDVLRNNVHTQLFFQTGVGDATALAGDVVGRGSREDVRQALIRQGVGEALLVRRGHPSIPVRTLLSQDPDVEHGAAQELRRDALARSGQPRAEVETEIEQRLSGMRRQAALDAGGNSTWEVRHERVPKQHRLP